MNAGGGGRHSERSQVGCESSGPDVLNQAVERGRGRSRRCEQCDEEVILNEVNINETSTLWLAFYRHVGREKKLFSCVEFSAFGPQGDVVLSVPIPVFVLGPLGGAAPAPTAALFAVFDAGLAVFVVPVSRTRSGAGALAARLSVMPALVTVLETGREGG